MILAAPFFGIALFFAGTGPALANAPPAEAIVIEWAKRSSHPLIGKALITATGQLIDTVAIASTTTNRAPIAHALGLVGPDYVLLGEVHDNPEHHWLRAALIEPLMERTPWGPLLHPGVVTEHLDETAAPRLLALSAEGSRSADEFFAAVAWDKSGWPDSRIFAPLYQAILSKRLELVPGNLPTATVRGLARQGLASAPADLVQNLRLDAPLPTPLQAALTDELKSSHCGLLPDAALPRMSLAQYARDASMARAMTRTVDRHGRAVLLAGNGHARTDRGVPWHIRAVRPAASIVALIMVEVADGSDDPAAYVWRSPDGNPAASVVVFTPRTDRPDPCEQMRVHMRSKQ